MKELILQSVSVEVSFLFVLFFRRGIAEFAPNVSYYL